MVPKSTMKRIPSIIFIILCLSFLACKKEKKTTTEPALKDSDKYYYLDAVIKPYLFKTGSYWVFENDSTGVLDSVIVTSTQTGFYQTYPAVHGNPGGSHVEFYKMNLKSCLTNTYYNHYLAGNSIKLNGGGEYGENGQSMYAANSPVGTEFSGMSIDSKFSTLTLKNNHFTNVDKVKIIAANQRKHEFTNDTYLYFTSAVGLIKKETLLGLNNIESWSIKRWHVIK